MSRHLLAIAVATALSTTLIACSGSSDSGDADGDTTGGDASGGGTVAVDSSGESPAVSGAGEPGDDTKAGTYIGSFGFGDGDGVYVIDRNDDLAGLTLNEDGSAVSVFGNLGGDDTYSGSLLRQTHDPSDPPSAGVFGTGSLELQSTDSYALSFGPDGIESAGGEANLDRAVGTELPPATFDTVSGNWSSTSQFAACTSEAECRLLFDVTFSDSAVSGSTSVQNGLGETTRENAINGSVAEYGNVLLLSFNWDSGDDTFTYDGVAFFVPDGAERRLVFLGESPAAASAGTLPTLATLLSRP